jgi:hypothetical protein
MRTVLPPFAPDGPLPAGRNGAPGRGGPVPARLAPVAPWKDRARSARGRRRRTPTFDWNAHAPNGTQIVRSSDRRPARSAKPSDMSLFRFLLRWSWLIAIMTVLGVAGGFAFMQYGPVPFQSTVTLMLRPQLDPSGEPVVAANPQRATASATALAGQAASPSVYQATSRALAGQMDVSSDELANLVLNGRIQIMPMGASSFITISASDPDPNRAWLLADGYSRGFMQDLAVQARLVSEQQQAELRAQINVLQQQLISVPMTSSDTGTVNTFTNVHGRILQNILDTQARLSAIQQQGPPVLRYGDTSAPVVAVNAKRVMIAGAAVGGLFGLMLAYLCELLRQWGQRRARAREWRAILAGKQAFDSTPARSTSASDHRHQPEGSDGRFLEEGRPRWAGSARV